MAQLTSIQNHETWTKARPVASRLAEDEIESLDERPVAKVADPAPLGLWAFATGTWVTGTVIAGVFPVTPLTAAIPVRLLFAGLAQFTLTITALRTNWALVLTLACLATGYALAAVANLTNSVGNGVFGFIGNIGASPRSSPTTRGWCTS